MKAIEIFNRKIEVKLDQLSIKIDKEIEYFGLNKITANNIVKLLNESGVDNTGQVWIYTNKIFHVLRVTSQNDAEYEIQRIKDKDKFSYNKKNYISLIWILDYLNKKATRTPNNDILKAVVNIFNKINFDKVVEGEREKYNKNLKKSLKNLSKARIESKKIKNDELKNIPLEKAYEFHHIRARSIIGNDIYELDIELGLVINKDTHKDITKKNIKDEDELYVYCFHKEYNLDWYMPFKNQISKYRL